MRARLEIRFLKKKHIRARRLETRERKHDLDNVHIEPANSENAFMNLC